MAVKTCPKCSGKVAESRNTCPHCGYVFEEKENTDKKQCPECLELVGASLTECPICGHLFEEEKKEKLIDICCPSCGSKEYKKQDSDTYLCASCGSTYRVSDDKTIIINNITNVTADVMDSGLPAHITVFKASLSRDSFKASAYKFLRDDSKTPDDIFDASFGEVMESDADFYLVNGTADINYQRSIGYDHEEEYTTTEYRHVDKGDKYTIKGVTKVCEYEGKYQVDCVKTRTVTEWHPDSGKITGEDCCIAEVPKDSQRSGFVARSLEEFDFDALNPKLIKSSEKSEYSSLPIDTLKDAVLKSVYYSHQQRSGDHIKDEHYNGEVRIKGQKLFRIPFYTISLNYKGREYQITAPALGKGITGFLSSYTFPVTELEKEKKELEKKIDKRTHTFNVLFIISGIILLLGFLFIFIMQIPRIVCIILMALGLACLILFKVLACVSDNKKFDKMAEYERNKKNLKEEGCSKKLSEENLPE